MSALPHPDSFESEAEALDAMRVYAEAAALVEVPAQGHSRLVPLMTLACIGPCGTSVDPHQPSTFVLGRVGGDSANGYEPVCRACL